MNDTRFLQQSVGRSAQLIAGLLDQIEAAATALTAEHGESEPQDLASRLEVHWRVLAGELRPLVRRLETSASWQDQGHEGG